MSTEEKAEVQPEVQTEVDGSVTSEEVQRNKYMKILIAIRDFLAKPQVLSGITIVVLIVFMAVFVAQTRAVLGAQDQMHKEHHETVVTLKDDIFSSMNRRDTEIFDHLEKRDSEVIQNTESVADLYKQLSELQKTVADLVTAEEEAAEMAKAAEAEAKAAAETEAKEQEAEKKGVCTYINPLNWPLINRLRKRDNPEK